jgi:phytoene synthase
MTARDADVAAAYDVCEQITRSEARNFSYGIRLLPPPKRRAMSAVYATARRIDDIGDGDLPDHEKLTRLDALECSLQRLAEQDGDPVLLALADAVKRYPIPVDAFGEIVAGCRADVSVHRYEDFDELVGYCRWVAGSVGRLSVGVYAPPDLDRAAPLADSLGVALQLTNILRDLREDRLADRVYLPQEDLRRFGCSLELDADGALCDPPDRFAALVRFQAERALGWYDAGLRLLPLLDRRAAACTAAMAGIYRRLLMRIAENPEQVRTRRTSLSGGAKLAVAARALVRGQA